MKTAFPARSTAILLILLALIAQIKGCTRQQQHEAELRFQKTDTESPFLTRVAKTTEAMEADSFWFNARTILLGAGLFCGLLWMRQRVRQRAFKRLHPEPTSKPLSVQNSTRRIVRRRRR
ncbi:hypothetical protein [Prosthecobacter dejongeii]|uniref:Cytochrome c biogenesis protein ResB n=1 Tax=Prosthecobacter dejongeii TaxID=48465 RepID=A0A7W7YPB1_9BACT|nr:hypothetical protein [Prosthecobacter dejongeii]MBB5039865.1 cytochrome c biogenesis protein ResB [Prosthecobacter dejongeii]